VTAWDQLLPYILMAYTSSVHEATKCTPAKVLFDTELRLPVDLFLGRPQEEVSQTVTEYVTDLTEKLGSVHQFCRGQLQLVSDRMKERYNLLQTVEALEKGDAVWLHTTQRRKGLSPKLQKPWEGPYVITKKINNLIYLIQLGLLRSKAKVVHRNRLWKYSSPNPPTWDQLRRGKCNE
jgi:hypothetical protein